MLEAAVKVLIHTYFRYARQDGHWSDYKQKTHEMGHCSELNIVLSFFHKY